MWLVWNGLTMSCLYVILYCAIFFSRKRRRAAHHYIKKIIKWDKNPYNTTHKNHTQLYTHALHCCSQWQWISCNKVLINQRVILLALKKFKRYLQVNTKNNNSSKPRGSVSRHTSFWPIASGGLCLCSHFLVRSDKAPHSFMLVLA